MTMRLLTLNTHSLIEENYAVKCEIFAHEVSLLQPHVIALQEVNQSMDAKTVENLPRGYTPCGCCPPLREDNHVLRVVSLLRKRGMDYHFAWLPIKKGYGKYEEGVAILSRSPITAIYTCCVSFRDDFEDWRTRKLLGVTLQDVPNVRFYSAHLGWWQDGENSFSHQWGKTLDHLSDAHDAVIMGDFNNPAETRGEGYDTVATSGFYDAYTMAARREGRCTVPTRDKHIDGWQGRLYPEDGMRIDQIWMKHPHPVSLHATLFDGVRGETVSDHYGVMADIDLPVP